MNYSELKLRIYGYLGFYGVGESAETDALIEECLAELTEIECFRYLCRAFEEVPSFLLKEPYLSYLQGSRGVMLCVMTLGAEVDRKIKYYARTDLSKSVVLDACASAYLEYRSDEYEKTLGDFDYRFCPGYGGSDVKDVREIFALVKPEKIGVTLLDNNYMLPNKTMAGILATGAKQKGQCGNCILVSHCRFRKEGLRCYGSENK